MTTHNTTSTHDGQPLLFGETADVINQGKASKREAFTESRLEHPTQRGRVLEVIASAGVRGWTREELAEQLRLPLASVCGRVNELKAAGLVVDTDRRRETNAGKRAAVVICREFLGRPVPPNLDQLKRPTKGDSMTSETMPDQVTCPKTPRDDRGELIQSGQSYVLSLPGSRSVRVDVMEDITTGDLYYRKLGGERERSQRVDESDRAATWTRV